VIPERPPRRTFLGALAGGLLSAPCLALGQTALKVYRIGYLSASSGTPQAPTVEAFRQGLSALGWAESQNIAIEYRWADGHFDRLPALAAELVGLKVDLILASPTPAAVGAQKATTTIPIVGVSLTDPVGLGIVASLARPGGNVTGVSYSVGPEIFGKDLALLKELTPQTRRFAVLANPAGPAYSVTIKNIEEAARSLDLQLRFFAARGPADFDGAFATMARERVGAVFVVTDPAFIQHRTRLTALAAKNRLPSMFTQRADVEAGGLMSYGPNLPELYRRAATYVDKIFKGAKPGDLPIEQPTTFELAINLRTAKAIGVTIPPSILRRADRVIE
jgi:putative tryptophan/tyrosine transport system substrate-binding protein